MYTLYSHIIRNNRGDICALISDKFKFKFKLNVVGGIRLTSYTPISPHDIINFMNKMSKAVVDVFKETTTFKTEFFYVDIRKKKSRVLTFLEFEDKFEDKSHPFDKIGELVLELPILEWEVLFTLLEEARDFFQENLL